MGNKTRDVSEKVAHQGSRGIKQGKKVIKNRIQKRQADENSRKKKKNKQDAEESLTKDDIRCKTGEEIEINAKESQSHSPIVKTYGGETIKTEKRAIKKAETAEDISVKGVKKIKENFQLAMKKVAQDAVKAKRLMQQEVIVVKKAAKRVAAVIVSSVKGIIASTKGIVALLTSGGGIAVLILAVVILFGGALCMIGGENANAVMPVSAEVEAYDSVIRKYANQYGILEYVDLIKAIMMQESGGRGLDPMQSSEGPFNTRYPKKPNGITDPEYSISCGVQEIKACLKSAEVENPVDIEHIKLALQGYNFGNGYISWAKRKYGGYTPMNAAEFSDMMAQRLGCEKYGDKQYVSHVLRYYPFGRIPTGAGSTAIVQVALSQEGNVGGQPYWSWYGFNSRVEWCACFVSWCAEQCGYIDTGIIPKFALCSDGVRWFDSRGQFQDGSYVPMPGDIIFFDWGANGDVNHVGIVEYVENGVVHTIEGNSGNRCRKRSYVIGNNEIYGYGVPVY